MTTQRDATIMHEIPIKVNVHDPLRRHDARGFTHLTHKNTKIYNTTKPSRRGHPIPDDPQKVERRLPKIKEKSDITEDGHRKIAGSPTISTLFASRHGIRVSSSKQAPS